MFFGNDLGNWKEYESLNKKTFFGNEEYWKKYNGISATLAKEIPQAFLYEVVCCYGYYVIGNSDNEEMLQKFLELPEILRYTMLIGLYEGEINNGGFAQFYDNIGYIVFELQKGLKFFGLKKNKKLIDKSISLIKKRIDISNYYELCSKEELPLDEIDDELSKLDDRFYEYPEDFTEIINSYLDKNREQLITIK